MELLNEITTQYLNRNNEYITMYLFRDKDGFLLTDGGDSIIFIEKKDTFNSIKQILHSIGYVDINIEKKELYVRASSEEELAEKQKYLLQSILYINLVRELTENQTPGNPYF